MRRLLPIVLALVVSASACGGKSPTSPSTNTPPPSATPTRLIKLSGAMSFGSIQINSPFEATLNVANEGNSPLTITGLTGTNGITNVITVTPTSGTVQPGGNFPIRVRFTPVAPVTYSGTIGVTSDATGGTSTIAFSGTGSLQGIPIFRQTGTGDNVFDIPNYVTRLRITGVYNQNSSNFIVRVSNSLVVNELLGTFWGMTRYEGVHLISGGGTVQITNSSGVAWSFEEVR